jgi:undecaprenyl-diphosphatase
MARWRIGATALDHRVARAIAHRATPALERPSRVLTWCADEHFVLLIATGFWLASRAGNVNLRREADHLMTSVAISAVLPHLVKRVFAQERPDRLEIHGRRHGIPYSGEAYDAFPSGHAAHVGAIASAISGAAPRLAPFVWTIGGLVAATRIVLLAHWTTDVLAGLAMGIGVERLLRLLRFKPGDPRRRSLN